VESDGEDAGYYEPKRTAINGVVYVPTNATPPPKPLDRVLSRIEASMDAQIPGFSGLFGGALSRSMRAHIDSGGFMWNEPEQKMPGDKPDLPIVNYMGGDFSSTDDFTIIGSPEQKVFDITTPTIERAPIFGDLEELTEEQTSQMVDRIIETSRRVFDKAVASSVQDDDLLANPINVLDMESVRSLLTKRSPLFDQLSGMDVKPLDILPREFKPSVTVNDEITNAKVPDILKKEGEDGD
jgi:hypothetical protein